MANIAYPKIIDETLMNVGPMGVSGGSLSTNGITGSALGTPEWWKVTGLEHDKALGIAHYYVDKNRLHAW